MGNLVLRSRIYVMDSDIGSPCGTIPCINGGAPSLLRDSLVRVWCKYSVRRGTGISDDYNGTKGGKETTKCAVQKQCLPCVVSESRASPPITSPLSSRKS